MKKIFLTGLACLLPFTVTIFIALWVMKILTKPFVGVVTPFLKNLPISEGLILELSQLLVLAALFVFILILGVIGRWFLFEKLLKIADGILHRIPIFNKIYKTAKEAIQPFFMDGSTSLQQVVLIPFPSSHSFILGLVAAESPETCSKSIDTPLVSVFLPTSPNPSTGFMIMRPKSELIYLEMESSEALKYIVSCGVAPPTKASP